MLSEEDKLATLDLRPFMDPSPYVVNELMPLRRVYRLFNEIGVRHLTVVDCREQVVGIVTRKDILPHNIEHKLLQEDEVLKAEKVLQLAQGEKPRRSSALLAFEGAMSALGKVAGIHQSKSEQHLRARRSHAVAEASSSAESPEEAPHPNSPVRRRSSNTAPTTRRGEATLGGASTVTLQSGDEVVQTCPQVRRSFLNRSPGSLRPSIGRERPSLAASLTSTISGRARNTSTNGDDAVSTAVDDVELAGRPPLASQASRRTH